MITFLIAFTFVMTMATLETCCGLESTPTVKDNEDRAV